MVDMRNILEIQQFGLQRSGNHLIVSWIARHFDKPIVFLNNAAPFSDPFLTFRNASVENCMPLYKRRLMENEYELDLLRSSVKDLIFISYENFRFNKLDGNRDLISNRVDTVGCSSKLIRVLLLRDFFNWIASFIRLYENRNKDLLAFFSQIDGHINRWLLYAKEFVGETDFLTIGCTKTIVISYNEFVESKIYRNKLNNFFGFDERDLDINSVPNVGGGSSFDKVSLSGKANSMAVTERWHYLLDSRFSGVVDRIVAREDEINYYNSLIFSMQWPNLSR